MEASFVFRLFSFIYIFDHYVGLVRLLDIKHFFLELTFDDLPWERLFTQLALKFGKIVSGDNANNFFFNFAVDPHFQTLNMHNFARTFTITRGNQEIILRYFVAEAKFACPIHFFIRNVKPLKLFQKTLLFLPLPFFTPDFHRPELNSSQFEHISLFFNYIQPYLVDSPEPLLCCL